MNDKEVKEYGDNSSDSNKCVNVDDIEVEPKISGPLSGINLRKLMSPSVKKNHGKPPN